MAAIVALVSTFTRKRPRHAPVSVSGKPSEPVVLGPSHVRYLEITPNQVKPRSIVNVFAEVTNTGSEMSSFSVVLKTKGVVEAVKEVTLGPGQNQKVAFVILKDKPGVYDLDLDGLKGSFTVTR